MSIAVTLLFVDRYRWITAVLSPTPEA